jgi:cytochrome c-type biogenesis protein CcmE
MMDTPVVAEKRVRTFWPRLFRWAGIALAVLLALTALAVLNNNTTLFVIPRALNFLRSSTMQSIARRSGSCSIRKSRAIRR